MAFTLPSAIENSGPPPGVPLMLIVSALAALAVWPLRRQSAGATARRES